MTLIRGVADRESDRTILRQAQDVPFDLSSRSTLRQAQDGQAQGRQGSGWRDRGENYEPALAALNAGVAKGVTDG